MYRNFEQIDNIDHISLCKSKGLSDEFIKSLAASNSKYLNLLHNSLPLLNFIVTKTRVKFDGSCLKQNKIIFSHGKR